MKKAKYSTEFIELSKSNLESQVQIYSKLEVEKNFLQKSVDSRLLAIEDINLQLSRLKVIISDLRKIVNLE